MFQVISKFTYYIPKLWIIILDIIFMVMSVCGVFMLLPLTTQTPFQKYALSVICLGIIWIVLSYFLQRYRKLSSRTFFANIFALFYVSLIVIGIFYLFILIQPHSTYSPRVLFSIFITLFVLEYFWLFLYYAWKYATQYDVAEYAFSTTPRDDAKAAVSLPLDADAAKERKEKIIENIGEDAFQHLSEHLNVNYTGTLPLMEYDLHELSLQDPYKYDTYILLKKLNKTRGVNELFSLINDKLPDNGLIVCSFKSLANEKKRILSRKNKFIAYLCYYCYCFFHRIIPDIFLTRRLYFDFTNGENRLFSKTEVLGRLYYSGFEVENEVEINHVNYVIARRVKGPINEGNRKYGALIKLKRYGKNKKLFTVYKFRTMHPYSEFLQDYVYEHNQLDVGGKFKNDMRVSTIGRVLRKCWLDEIPMIYNLLNGDMKLVGVRPLSKQYFELYSEELQEMRVKFKPGLLPPFYADMPKTLKEIQDSEMKYLVACEKNGVICTDFTYFFQIIYNILFKHARSA